MQAKASARRKPLPKIRCARCTASYGSFRAVDDGLVCMNCLREDANTRELERQRAREATEKATADGPSEGNRAPEDGLESLD